MPVPCLRAGLFIYLFIYLCWSLWKCATLLCLCVGRGIVVLCALVLVSCGWLVVNRAFEPVERVMCLNVAIASCLAMVVVPSISLLGLSSFFLLLFA
jgi:hypothetical protein